VKSHDISNSVAAPGRSRQRYISEKEFSLQNKENYDKVMLEQITAIRILRKMIL
jgi:hypothetical protein